jgi:hypothetical protein
LLLVLAFRLLLTAVVPAQNKWPSSRQRLVTPKGYVERQEWHCQSHWREGPGGEIGEMDVWRMFNRRCLDEEFGGFNGLFGEKGEVGMDKLDG